MRMMKLNHRLLYMHRRRQIRDRSKSCLASHPMTSLSLYNFVDACLSANQMLSFQTEGLLQGVKGRPHPVNKM
jgi:hypothetical protein